MAYAEVLLNSNTITHFNVDNEADFSNRTQISKTTQSRHEKYHQRIIWSSKKATRHARMYEEVFVEYKNTNTQPEVYIVKV